MRPFVYSPVLCSAV